MYVWSAHHEEKQIECIVNEWQARVEIAGVEGYAYTHFVCWTEKWTKNRRQQQNAVAKRMNKRNKSAVDRRVTAEYRRSLSLSIPLYFSCVTQNGLSFSGGDCGNRRRTYGTDPYMNIKAMYAILRMSRQHTDIKWNRNSPAGRHTLPTQEYR